MDNRSHVLSIEKRGTRLFEHISHPPSCSPQECPYADLIGVDLQPGDYKVTGGASPVFEAVEPETEEPMDPEAEPYSIVEVDLDGSSEG